MSINDANGNLHSDTDGRFTDKTGTRPTGTLTSTPAPTPVGTSVTLERWDTHNNIVQVGDTDFDAREVLDTADLDDVDSFLTGSDGDADWVFEQAVRLGLTGKHDGPFSVHLDREELAVYAEQRRTAGAIEAAPNLRTLDRLNTAAQEITKRRIALDEEEFAIGLEGVSRVILDKFPDAATFRVWDVADDYDGPTVELDPKEIYDADGHQLWDEGDQATGWDELVSWTRLLEKAPAGHGNTFTLKR